MARALVALSTLAFALVLVLAGTACSDDGGGSDSADDAGRDGATDNGRDTSVASCVTRNPACGSGLVCDPDLDACVPACLGALDCAPTERCDTASGLCQDRAACTTAAECTAANETCDTCLGVCVDSEGGAFCIEDVNCPDFDQYCDTCIAECRVRGAFCEPCREDDECGAAADACLTDAGGHRFCGVACGPSLPPCPVGGICDVESGQCAPLTGDCAQLSECDGDTDCAGAQVCSATNICIEGCTVDESCPSTNVCVGGRCEPACSTADDCDPGEECDAGGHCRVPGSCVTSWDCPEAGMHCERATGECASGCEVDDDCRTFSQVCRDAACVARGCRGNYSCAFGQVCNLQSGACTEPSEPHCSTCNGDDVESCGAGNVCIALQDGEGTDQGAFCWLACAADPENACPQGYACTDVELQQQGGASETRRVCARACYRTPI